MRILKRPLVIGIGGLALVAMLAATFVLFMRPASAAEPADISVQQVMSVAKSHHIGGVIVAGTSNNGGDHHPSETVPFVGAPPLMFNGSPAGTNCFFAPCFNGNVMMTASTGPLISVTSAGQITEAGRPPYFVLIERALRDGDIPSRGDECGELLIGHRAAIHPESINGHPVDRSFLWIAVV